MLNAVRAASGLASVTWSNILPAGVPPVQSSSRIHYQHVQQLRTWMDGALTQLGVPLVSYTGSVQSNTLIRAYHVNEIQERAR